MKPTACATFACRGSRLVLTAPSLSLPSLALVSLTLALLPARAVAHPVVVDSFSTDQATLLLSFPPAGTTAAASASGADVVGGERDLQIELLAGGAVGNGIGAEVAAGSFVHSVDDQVYGYSRLQWDGADASPALNPAGLGGIDLTAGGTQDALRIRFSITDDVAPLAATLELQVFTDAANASLAAFVPGWTNGAYHDLVVPYSSFAPLEGTGADFTDVGAVTLAVGPPAGPNVFPAYPVVSIDFIRTTSTLAGGSPVEVPTLGGWGILILTAALAALGARTRGVEARGG